jgi:hypothetical protein
VPILRNTAWQARAFWALLASALKHEWTIEDYPIVARFQRDSHVPRESRLKPSPWIAAIVNWPAISGNGNTKLEALEDLRRSFDRFKATKNKLPRPGTKVPIEFADRNRVSQHPELKAIYSIKLKGISPWPTWTAHDYENQLALSPTGRLIAIVNDGVLKVYQIPDRSQELRHLN